jgi:hypothetical protein
MLGLFSRPVRRPRIVQSQFRTVLRLESLEGRAVPAAHALSVATYTPESTVVLTGQIQDDSASGTGVAQTTGGTGGTMAMGPIGGHNIAAKPLLENVTITQTEDGTWHIRGHVDGGAPVGTVIEVLNGPGNSTGQGVTVDSDGNFDLAIDLDPGTPGGQITIDAVNQTTGTHSSQWSGLIG